MAEPIIKIENVAKEYDNKATTQVVIDKINFEVSTGEFVCIVGPSGCGKSTILRIISNLLPPSKGKVELAGKPKLAMVFQNFALFPWLTIEENVGFGLKMSGMNQAKINQLTKKYIEEIGLTSVSDKHPKELSGGMRQRVGIARALAVSPDILLLDEPFSALDVFTANRLRQDLLKIWKSSNITVVMVSHLIEEAIELADKVIVLSSSPGKVVGIEKIDLPRPRNTRSSEFFKLVDKIQEMIKV